MDRRGWAAGAIGMAAAVLAAAGCGGSSASLTSGSAASATGASSAQAPAVRFLQPADGATVRGPVTARVQLVHFTLDAADVGKQAKAGQGHLHFAMDGGRFDFPRYSGANGQLAVKLGIQGKYSPSVTPTITYRDLPPGRHTLVVFLANSDHSPVGVSAQTTFTVR